MGKTVQAVVAFLFAAGAVFSAEIRSMDFDSPIGNNVIAWDAGSFGGFVNTANNDGSVAGAQGAGWGWFNSLHSGGLTLVGRNYIDLGTVSAAGITYMFSGDFGWRYGTAAAAGDLYLKTWNNGFSVDGVLQAADTDFSFGTLASSELGSYSFSYTTGPEDVGKPIRLSIGVLDAGATDGVLTQLLTDNWTVEAGDHPNVIMILVDDMGWMDSSTYGSTYYQTPNLTRLADVGMLFTDAYAASPLCSPTRASILSGQYPSRLQLTLAITSGSVPDPQALPPEGGGYCGDVQSLDRLPLETVTLAEALKAGGYNTAHIGKWHLSPSTSLDETFYADNQGFDFVIGGGHLAGPPDYYSPYTNDWSDGIRNLTPGPEGEYLNERLAEECVQWISSVKDSGKPFFLNFWHYAVHTPVVAKEDLLAKYEALRDPDADQRCPEMATMIESMDSSIGILLDWLDQPANSALKENTLIILTSDNGGVTHLDVNGNTLTSNRPLRGGKANTYEGGVREPWIVRWPGKVQAGATNHTPVQTVDIYPTVLDVADVDTPNGVLFDGQSLASVFAGSSTNHQPVFTDFPHLFGVMCAPSSSVRDGSYKLIRYYHAGENAASHAYELFDLKQDPFESINLASYLPGKVQELDSLIEQHLTETSALIPVASTNYTGSAVEIPRYNELLAPDRPLSLHLAETALQCTEAGSRTVQLLDQDGVPCRTHALILDGAEWVRVEDRSDGSVSVEWDDPPNNASARILFGWSGGATVHEINDWTLDSQELVLFSTEPFGGVNAAVPGTVEAENYDLGGEGKGYHDVDGMDSSTYDYRADGVDIQRSQGRYHVGWFFPGDWMEYTVDAVEGTYTLFLNISTAHDGGRIELTLNGTNSLAVVDIPNTGTWGYPYTAVPVLNVQVPGGSNQVLRVRQVGADGSGVNIDSVRFLLNENYAVADGSFENPPENTDAYSAWRSCHPGWNPGVQSEWQLANPGHFSAAADGVWSAAAWNLGGIRQDAGTDVQVGDTVTVSFAGGRGRNIENWSPEGGVLRCTFRVGSVPYSMAVDTSVLPNDTWQTYTHSVTVYNSGPLRLEFSAESGKPWLDDVGDVLIRRDPLDGFFGASTNEFAEMIIGQSDGTSEFTLTDDDLLCADLKIAADGLKRGSTSGALYLDGGTLTCDSLDIGFSGQLDIRGGTLILNDPSYLRKLLYWVDEGRIYGYGGAGSVQISSSGSALILTASEAQESASQPDPAEFEDRVPSGLARNLSWTSGGGALSHRIYFGTNALDVVEGAPRVFLGSSEVAEVDSPVLDPGTQYFWRVDEVTAVQTNRGSVWSFRTDSPGRYAFREEELDAMFSDPPNEYRIVRYQLTDGALSQYPEYGFGGYNSFVYRDLYEQDLEGPDEWRAMVEAVNAQDRTVWIGDDDGYPSGGVTGKVVENNPEYEVRGVAMLTQTGSGAVPVSISAPADVERMVSAVLYPVSNGVPDFSQGVLQTVEDRSVTTTGLAGDWMLSAFIVDARDSATQAQSTTNQFGSTGHYADLLNPDAVASWISLVHEPALDLLSDPASMVEGFYYNEPSLMQLNWANVPYAYLSWNDRLFDMFYSMHGYDLKPSMGALYQGSDLYSKRVRMNYHQTVAEMLRESFSGQIADWCGRHGVVLSGHPLIEESLPMHVANFGDLLKITAEQQVPAVDLPIPEETNAEYPGGVTMATINSHFPKLMSSAGAWNEADGRMIGLLDPIIGGYADARLSPDIPILCNTINRAARCGVNLFTSYIPHTATNYTETAGFNQVNEYAGRISLMLTGARLSTSVALYYPIEMFQTEYTPVTTAHWSLWDTPRQEKWDALQTTMLDAGTDYNIVHPEWVRDARIENGQLKIGSGSYRYLVMPDMGLISSNVLVKIQQFEAVGGTVLWVDSIPSAGSDPAEDAYVETSVDGYMPVSVSQVPGLIENPYADAFSLNITPGGSVYTARFDREGRCLYFMGNADGNPVTVSLSDANGGGVKIYDPVSGGITVKALPADVYIDSYRSLIISPVSTDAAEIAAVDDSSFENPPGTGDWRACHASWNDLGTGIYEVLRSPGHMMVAAGGEWSGLMSNMKEIHQDLTADADAGDTLSVSFFGGRAASTFNTAGGGVFSCSLTVGGVSYPLSVDTTLLSPDTWQFYEHTVTLTNSGSLRLAFSNMSGTSWLDHISDVWIRPAPVAAFTAFPVSGYAPLSVSFSDTSISSAEITNRLWALGAGLSTNTAADVLTYTYDSPGVYAVGLNVNSSLGSSSAIQSNLIHVAAVPQPDFSAGGGIQTGISAGQVHLTVEALDGLQYRILYLDDLQSSAGWQVLTPPSPDGWTNSSGGSLILFADPDATNVLQRFYRVESKSVDAE